MFMWFVCSSIFHIMIISWAPNVIKFYSINIIEMICYSNKIYLIPRNKIFFHWQRMQSRLRNHRAYVSIYPTYNWWQVSTKFPYLHKLLVDNLSAKIKHKIGVRNLTYLCTWWCFHMYPKRQNKTYLSRYDYLHLSLCSITGWTRS